MTRRYDKKFLRDLSVLLRTRPDAELVELRGHVLGRRRGLDVLVDGQNCSVLADVERPAIRHAHPAENAVDFCGLLRGIAEEREVRVLLLSERRVLVKRIDADHEIGDVVLLDQVPVFRQRLALERAAAGVRLRKPGQYDCLLVPEIRDLVRLAVARLQREVRRRIADFQLRGGGHLSDRSECEQAQCKYCEGSHRISKRWTNWSSSVSLRSETAQKAISACVQCRPWKPRSVRPSAGPSWLSVAGQTKTLIVCLLHPFTHPPPASPPPPPHRPPPHQN